MVGLGRSDNALQPVEEFEGDIKTWQEIGRL